MAHSDRDTERFDALAKQRVKLGLTVADIGERTGIPTPHLEALERGDLEDIPDGPYLDAYYRAYCRALGLNPGNSSMNTAPPHPSMAKPPPTVPMWVVRAVAFGAAGALLAWSTYQMMGLEGTDTGNASVVVQPELKEDQVVTLQVRKAGFFRVSLDGNWVLERTLAEGFQKEFRAKDKIEMVVPGAGSVRLHYNGRAIVPQGLQNKPRRLLFVDDENKDPK